MPTNGTRRAGAPPAGAAALARDARAIIAESVPASVSLRVARLRRGAGHLAARRRQRAVARDLRATHRASSPALRARARCRCHAPRGTRQTDAIVDAVAGVAAAPVSQRVRRRLVASMNARPRGETS
jgi:hypothetical protein